MEYLGFWVTHESVRPTAKNIIHSRYGSYKEYKGGSYIYQNNNCYMYMWVRRSHTIQELTKLTSVCVKFK